MDIYVQTMDALLVHIVNELQMNDSMVYLKRTYELRKDT